MKYTVDRRADGQWVLKGPGIEYHGRLYPTKQEAIFAAEFLGKDQSRIEIDVHDPDEERFPTPDYWRGDMSDPT